MTEEVYTRLMYQYDKGQLDFAETMQETIAEFRAKGASDADIIAGIEGSITIMARELAEKLGGTT